MFPGPEKSISTVRPQKGRINLGSVNSKVGTWAPASSLLMQKAWSNHLRLVSLPLKSCSYCSPNRRCCKTLGSKLTIFTSHQMKQLLNGKNHLFRYDQRILKYQAMLMENPVLSITLCEILNLSYPAYSPEGSFPFHSCLETLDHWTETPRGINRRSSDQSWGNRHTVESSFVLGGERRAVYAVVSNFKTIEVWKDGSRKVQLQPTWKGPYPLILSTPTAVRVPGHMTPGFTAQVLSCGRKQKRTLNTPVSPWEISDTHSGLQMSSIVMKRQKLSFGG